MSARKETQDPLYLVIHHTDILGKDEQAQIVDKSHQRRGYPPSTILNPVTGTGWHIAYHYLIGKDGTILQARPLDDRTQHSSCGLGLEKCVAIPFVNDKSIAIALAGDFSSEQPTQEQLHSLRKLVGDLDGKYHFQAILTHRDVSPTVCPGDNLVNAIRDLLRDNESNSVYGISRYYTPVRGQTKYFRTVSDKDFVHKALQFGLLEHIDGKYWFSYAEPYHVIGSSLEEADKWFSSQPSYKEAIRKEMEYLADFKVNCHGDCFKTANGFDLSTAQPYTVAACPPDMTFGTKLSIDGIGTVTCVDRGSAIKGRRIDIWAGAGMDGLNNVLTRSGGNFKVTVLDN